jgi:hypothetical protein
MQPHVRAFVERAVTFTDCPDCGGHPAQRGGPVLADRGISIADACAMQISDLAAGSAG